MALAEPGLPSRVRWRMAQRMDEDRPTQNRVFTVAGNGLTLLPDGLGRLTALIDLIDGARTSLRLLYYIYSDDDAGRRVRAALIRAAERGVRIALVVDGFGSNYDPGFFAPLKALGASVCTFIPRFGRRYLLRNHQKLALADEARVIIGGFNIEDGYFAGRDPDGWRDLGLLVEGPAAGRLAGYFDALAGWAEKPAARIRDLRRALAQWSEPSGPVRWLLGGPTRRLSPWALAVKRDMRRARRLDMIAAYFSPNPSMLRRIEDVARRGGRARVITAARSDNNATIAAARHTYRRLLRRGVEVGEYGRQKLHSKLIVAENVAHIGSANFDVRSLYLNLELMLRIDDAAFADHVRAYFDGEWAASTIITRESHARASSWLNRMRWALAYFLLAVVDGNVTRRLNFGVDGR